MFYKHTSTLDKLSLKKGHWESVKLCHTWVWKVNQECRLPGPTALMQPQHVDIWEAKIFFILINTYSAALRIRQQFTHNSFVSTMEGQQVRIGKREHKREWMAGWWSGANSGSHRSYCSKKRKITSISRDLLLMDVKWSEWIKSFQSNLTKTFVLQKIQVWLVFFQRRVKTDFEVLVFLAKMEV